MEGKITVKPVASSNDEDDMCTGDLLDRKLDMRQFTNQKHYEQITARKRVEDGKD